MASHAPLLDQGAIPPVVSDTPTAPVMAYTVGMAPYFYTPAAPMYAAHYNGEPNSARDKPSMANPRMDDTRAAKVCSSSRQACYKTRERVSCGRRIGAFCCSIVMPVAAMFVLFQFLLYGPLRLNDIRYVSEGNCTVIAHRMLDVRPDDPVGLYLPAIDVRLVTHTHRDMNAVALQRMSQDASWVSSTIEAVMFFRKYALETTYPCFYDPRWPARHAAFSYEPMDILGVAWLALMVTFLMGFVIYCGNRMAARVSRGPLDQQKPHDLV